MKVLVLALDLAKDGIQRMLQRSIQPVALRGAQLVEICEDPLPGLLAALAASPQVLHDFFAGKYSLSDVIKHGDPDYTTPTATPT
jgi:hypothetical protein